ncbi:MAG: hypothetical protein RIR70_109 [Pseudomonadota bacterium]|jgi:twitching motility protein PilI
MTGLATVSPVLSSKPVSPAAPGSGAALTKAARARPGASTMIGVQAGGQYWLVDLADARFAQVPPLAGVPLTRSWFRGLAAAEGSLLGVVDLSAFTGGALTPVTHESRLLHLPDFSTQTALLVGSVVGERKMSELMGAPNVPDPDCTWAGARLRDARGRVWQVLSLRALFAHPDFQDIGA